MNTTDSESQRRSRSMWIVIALFSCLFILFYLVQTGHIAGGKPACAVCSRPLAKAMTFTLLSHDGKRQTACCPRCGLRSVVGGGARALQATDFSDGQRIAAEKAYYLEGSQVAACGPHSTLRLENDVISDMHFDRCQPSLLAFARMNDALSYRQHEGGRVLNYLEAVKSVSRQMEHSPSGQ